MNYKSFFHQFKYPIYKDDVKLVIINGILTAIFFGFLLGFIDGFLAIINFPLSICLFLIGGFVGRKIRKSYYTYHILFPVLAVVFTLLGYVFFCYGSFVIINLYASKDFLLVIKSFFIPQNLFLNLIYNLAPIGIWGIIRLIFFVMTLFDSYRYAKAGY